MSEPSAPIATGAHIELGGKTLTVHCDCKDVRDELERFCRAQAVGYVDQMLAEGLIDKARHALQLETTFREIKSGAFAYGSTAFASWRFDTDAGLKHDLYSRLKLNHPTITLAAVSEWVETQPMLDSGNKWERARLVMAIADGFSPKSVTPAAGPRSAGDCSKSSPEASPTNDSAGSAMPI